MDIAIYIVTGLLMLIGLAGCIIPALPGPPLSYIGLLLLKFTPLGKEVGTWELVITGLVVVIVVVIDYVNPIIGAKRFGGTKYGNWGCAIGTVIGLFFQPFGIILGPFLGAVVGELIGKKEFKDALKAGFGAFIGFLFGFLLKMAVCLFITVRFVMLFF